MFKAIAQPPNLRSGLIDSFIARIESGDLQPGQRLPTEQAIMEATGVSRTIVREALAALRAKGLIITRQGLGAFVSNDPNPRTFSIIPNELESMEEVLRVIELRIGIESEAVALAALRRTDEDLERMESRLTAMDESLKNGGYGAEEDFAFHRAILVATQNSYYARLFDTFGAALMPRQWTRLTKMSDTGRKRHDARVRKEHRAIFNAIRDRNEKIARKALRAHLQLSASRFELLRDAQAEVGGQ